MSKSALASAACLAVGALVAATPASRLGRPSRPTSQPTSIAPRVPVRAAVQFVPDRDESSPDVRYAVRGPGFGATLRADGLLVALARPAETGAQRAARLLRDPGSPEPIGGTCGYVAMDLVGPSNDARVVAADPLPWRTNFFLGNDPAKWRRGVKTYVRAETLGAWPGVDLRWYEKGGLLEFDCVVAPGADASSIAFRVAGVAGRPARTRLDADGNVVVATESSDLVIRRPDVWHESDDGRREPVAGRFDVGPEDQDGARVVRFDVPGRDPSRALVIDPSMLAGAYAGAFGNDQPYAITRIGAGDVASVVKSDQPWYPNTPPLGGATIGMGDVVVTRFDKDFSVVLKAVFGGDKTETPRAAVGSSTDDLFVVGDTYSTNSPTTVGSYSGPGGTMGFSSRAFAFKLTAAFDLAAAANFGADSSVSVAAAAVGPAGDLYLAGTTQASNWTATAGAYMQRGTGLEGYVAKLSPQLDDLSKLSYLGVAQPLGASFLGDGTLGLVGAVDSSGLTTTANAWQTSFGGVRDGFVMKIHDDLSAPTLATYHGGPGFDVLSALKPLPAGSSVGDGAGSFVVTGVAGTTLTIPSITHSPAFTGAGNKAYAAVYGTSGAVLRGGFFGGSNNAIASSAFLTPHGCGIGGFSDSFGDFPIVTPLPLARPTSGTSGAFLIDLGPLAGGGFDVKSSTLFGPTGGYAVPGGAIERKTDETVAQWATASADAPVNPTPPAAAVPGNKTHGGGDDAWLVGVRWDSMAAVALMPPYRPKVSRITFDQRQAPPEYKAYFQVEQPKTAPGDARATKFNLYALTDGGRDDIGDVLGRLRRPPQPATKDERVVYGAGWFYVPGTDIHVDGYMRVEVDATAENATGESAASQVAELLFPSLFPKPPRIVKDSVSGGLALRIAHSMPRSRLDPPNIDTWQDVSIEQTGGLVWDAPIGPGWTDITKAATKKQVARVVIPAGRTYVDLPLVPPQSDHGATTFTVTATLDGKTTKLRKRLRF